MNRLSLFLLMLLPLGGLPLDAAEPNSDSAAAVPSAKTTSLFDGKTLDGWIQVPAGSWTVKDDAMASTGNGRGVIYTKDDYSRYRLTFKMRHVSGKPDHAACFLIFCTRPPEGQKGLDALGGIQFQVPNGGHWDYRKGHNNEGKGEYAPHSHPKFDARQWSQIEILVDAAKGTAHMAVAQPVGSSAVEVLDFNVPEAGKAGPIAWQMHNAGLFDEYKDVRIEVDPKQDGAARGENQLDSNASRGQPAGKPSETTRPITGVDRAYMDSAVSPCKDFYAYANGAFEKVPIPGEYAAYGVNQEIDERNFAILKEILEKSAKTGGPKGSVIQRVGDFYASGMDEATIEREGLNPLASWLSRIRAITNTKELIAVIARLQGLGLNVGFHFDVEIDDKDSATMIAGFSQGGLGLPERDYYFRKGKEAEEIRSAYVLHIARMLELAGDSTATAKAAADTIMAFETKLAKASRTLVDLRDPEKNYNKFERAKLMKLAPNLDWRGYFETIAFPGNETNLLVRQPEFFTAFDELLKSEPLTVWRDYLRWCLVSETANYLGKAFVEERFSFYGKKLNGTTELRPRWKRVMAAVDAGIGEDLGQLYVQKAFSPAAKARALTMVEFHKEAMRGRIRAATWMSQGTKVEAYKKLDTLRSKVGFPDKWRDYGKLDIARQPYVLNALAANAFEFQREMAKLGKPVDRGEWEMTPQTNNAYYEPTLNEICFPAAILQPPFFDEKADDATNYGAIGSTIGHELTHGFDDEGRQYDSKGNLRNWWTDEDAKGFESRAESVARQYDAFEVLPGLHINGHQTLGENIADIGGLRVAYAAFKLATKGKKLEPSDGFTPDQRFFIAFAQNWRTNERPEAVRLHVGSDVHSPVRWRVLGTVANFPEFQKAFDCPEPTESWPPIW